MYRTGAKSIVESTDKAMIHTSNLALAISDYQLAISN